MPNPIANASEENWTMVLVDETTRTEAEYIITETGVTTLQRENNSSEWILFPGMIKIDVEPLIAIITLSVSLNTVLLICCSILVAAMIVIISILLVCKWRRTGKDHSSNPAVYEEAADTIFKSVDTNFKCFDNGCYSSAILNLNDPIYAEVEDVIQMRHNHVYGFFEGQHHSP